jgi:hypothetical protein
MCSALSAMNCDIITRGGQVYWEPQMKHGRKSAAERTMALTMVSSSSRLSVHPARSTGPALFAGSPYYGSALAVLARTDLRRSHCRRSDPAAPRSARCRLSDYSFVPITD